MGPLIGARGLQDNTPQMVQAVSTIYENSHSIQRLNEEKDYNYMTRYELAQLATMIFKWAGIAGTRGMIDSVMDRWKLPAWPDNDHDNFKKTDVWDKLDLNNRPMLERYIYESLRLTTPVTVVNRVATEPFTVKVGSNDHTFPKGTNVAIPINLADMDKKFWGKDAHKFNTQRTGLVQNIAVFNGVGLDDTTFPD